MNTKPIKPKTCRSCKVKYTPARPLQACCSHECAFTYAIALRNKNNALQALKSRKETKLKLDKLKTKSQWLKEAQIEFNKFIRNRNIGLPCISCDKPMLKKVNAGHYRSVGSSPHLRFNVNNCHAQCEHCNSFLSGNIINYRINLIKRIGLKKLEQLESDNKSKHYTIEEIKELKLQYRQLCKDLKNEL